MKKNIRIITPITTKGIRTLDDVAPLARPDLTFSHTLLDIGPVSIESEYEAALSVPDTIAKAIQAEQEGAAAVVIDCMGDPGLRACREVVSIPVLGPAETAMHIASMFSEKFSIVTVLERARAPLSNLARVYGLGDRLASIRAINIPVLEIEQDMARLNKTLAQEAEKAVIEDDAAAIILGCTGFCGCAEAITNYLLDKLGIDIPVIDPIPTTVLVAASLVDANLAQSKKTYANPSAKEITGFNIPAFTRPTSAAE